MKNSIWYGVCQLYKRKYITILTVVMMLLCFVALEYAGIIYSRYRYSEWKAKGVITEDYSDVYNINLSKYAFASGDDIGKIKEFYDALKSVEGVEYSGLYFEDCSEDVDILYISKDIAQLCNLSIDIDSNKFIEKDTEYALVGQNVVDDYPIESIHYDKMTGLNYKVMQTMETDVRFISDDYYSSNGRIMNLDNCIVIECEALLDVDKGFVLNGLNNIYFVVSSGVDHNQVCMAIDKCAEEYDIDIYGINSMEQLFDKLAWEAAALAGEKYLMPVVLLVCSCIAMSIATLISMRTNRRDAGIMLANRMTRRDIIFVYVTENFVKVVVAYLLSILFWFLKANEYSDNAFEIFMHLVPFYIVAVVVVVVISSLAPIFYLKRKMPCELIGEEL